MHYDSTELAENVHTILIEMYGNPYPIREIIRNLSPRCKDIVVRCELLGTMRNCEELFEERITGIGICCVTNTQRPRLNQMTELFNRGERFPKVKHIHFLEGGRSNALSVALRNNYSDFAYKIGSNSNFRIMIFQAQEFPDNLSGATTENLVDPNIETDISLEPIYVDSDSSMENFPPSTRGCYFDGEGDLPLKGFYSISECALHCRIKDIIKTCDCVPPLVPNIYNATVCLLTDLPCLAKWREKWISFDSFYTEDEFMRSHPCAHCLSSCNYIKYDFRKTWKHLADPMNGFYKFGILKGYTNRDNIALIHVFFRLNYVRKMRQSVNGHWHYLLSYFGGICGLMFGASILSFVQFIYYLTGKFFYIWIMCGKHFFKNYRRKKVEKSKVKVGKLYWNEFCSNNNKH